MTDLNRVAQRESYIQSRREAASKLKDSVKNLLSANLGLSDQEVEVYLNDKVSEARLAGAATVQPLQERCDWSQYPLTIELVPKTAWYQNLRELLSKKEWDFIRKMVYRRANYRCEICGGVGQNHPVEAHEEWDYDWKTKVQSLRQIRALCPTCHMCKHAGLAQINGRLGEVIEHLQRVNKLSKQDATEMVFDAFHDWQIMSHHKWELDVRDLQEWLKKQHL